MFKKLFAVVAFALFGTGAAFAQTWPNLPIAGGASYSCGSVNGVSNCTVPAGPDLTAGAWVPADTHLSQGRSPQTVLVPIATLGGGIQSSSPLTGTSITVAPNVSKVMLTPAGTIAALTVLLPAATALFDGQEFYIASSQIVTALTLTAGTGSTLGTTTTALAVNTPIRYTYSAVNDVWIKG